MKCIKCNKEFEPTRNNIKKNHYLCNDCRRIYDKEWRKKRKALGLKTCGVASPEWIKNYKIEYYQRPHVKERMRDLARKYRLKKENRIKNLARWALRHAVDRGEVIKKPCEKCGILKVDGHHTDYTKPFDVIWLCRKCHHVEHKKLKPKSAIS